MPKTIAPEMWGMTEICQHVGLSRARVHQFRADPLLEFPEPHQTLKCGPIWVAEVIREWNAQRLAAKA